MSDDVVDNLATGPQVENVDATPEAGESDKEAVPYLLTFKDRTAAEHGYKEVQARATRAEQKAAELERELSRTAALEKLIEQNASRGQAEGRSQAEIDAEEAQLIQRFESEQGSREILNTIRKSYHLLDQDKVSKAEARTLTEKIAKLEAQLADMSVTSQADYQTHKEAIETLMRDDGLTRAQAMKVHMRYVKPAGEASPAPGAIGGSRATDTGGTTVDIDREIERVRAAVGDMTPDEVKEMRQKMVRKAARR